MSTTLTETPAQLLKLHPKDNVAVALKPLAAKTTLAFEGQTITLFEDIPQGHKIALKDLAQSQDVIKYGYPIGHLLADVKTGRGTPDSARGMGAYPQCQNQPFWYLSIHLCPRFASRPLSKKGCDVPRVPSGEWQSWDSE